MTKPTTPIYLILFSVLLVFTGPAAAIEEVYKWVDTEGATHYGQTPPAVQPASIEKVLLAAHNPDTITQPDIQATLAVAKQLEISRLERERFRLEKKKVQIEQLKALQAEQTAYTESRRYYGYSSSAYYPPYYGRPHRPHQPHKPYQPNPHKPNLSHHQTVAAHATSPH